MPNVKTLFSERIIIVLTNKCWWKWTASKTRHPIDMHFASSYKIDYVAHVKDILIEKGFQNCNIAVWKLVSVLCTNILANNLFKTLLIIAYKTGFFRKFFVNIGNYLVNKHKKKCKFKNISKNRSIWGNMTNIQTLSSQLVQFWLTLTSKCKHVVLSFIPKSVGVQF